jgi:hypothetical protein
MKEDGIDSAREWIGVEGISEILYLVILIEEERPVNR